MSSYRQIHSKIWKDDWFLELEPVNKLFFIYLFSNESASLAGIYELSMRVMSFESGLTMPEIRDAFEMFTSARKAYYQDGVVWVPKLRKYHESKSPKVQTRILKDLSGIKEGELKRIYCELYSIDTVSVSKNSVSIPPYTYTYTSTSTSSSTSKKGGVGENIYDGHEENTNQDRLDVMSAIACVVKESYPGNHDGRFERAAIMVMNLGAVDRVPGFGPWWTRNSYYNDNGLAALTTFMDEFKNYLGGVERVKVKANGYQDPTTVPNVSGRI